MRWPDQQSSLVPAILRASEPRAECTTQFALTCGDEID
jgi:hypothetical protein